jgi:hypothetical protein
MRRIRVHADVNGRELDYTHEVPPEWADWPDERRAAWARDMCHAYVSMRLWWADEDVFTPDGYWVEDEYSWPPRWTPDGEPVE